MAKNAPLGRCAFAIGFAVAVLTGCGGSQPPIGAPGAIPQTFSSAADADRDSSWMLPEAKTIKKLLYVSDGATNDVYVYNFDTRKLVGTLTGLTAPSGQCVDKKGDVWITGYTANSVVEYRHGGTNPAKVLHVSGSGPLTGCSVAPNGDLAVTGLYYYANVWIFKHASGSPKRVPATGNCFFPFWPGYDSKDNLYFESDSSGVYVCELASGSAELKTVRFDVSVGFQGGMMWDGKYITLEDTNYENAGQTAIYEMSEDASGNLTAVQKTVLSDNCDGDYNAVLQPFIVGRKNTPANDQVGHVVVGGNARCQGRFDFWKYPRGGDPEGTLPSSPSSPEGQSVSIAT